ncbi:MAG: right-handed parallel beta-helix repeat-containing protein, partial [Planctomycetota bacterium]|nr:right-handed parallel beta-helix repeat-containing protein [Planctomycetota bacterium]
IKKGQFSAKVPLKLGSNPIRLSAVDLCGNLTTEVITIYRRQAYHVVPNNVKADRPHCFEGLANAIKKIPPRSRLYLYPGTYSGDIDIDKTLELIGVGDRRKILISSSGRPLRLMAAKIHLKNLNIEATGSRGNGAAIDIHKNDCIIEQCILNSEFSQGIAVGNYPGTNNFKGPSAKTKGTRIIDCQFVNCRAYGLIIHSGSRALVSRCLFKGNGAGANVMNGSSARFENCQFTDNYKGLNASYDSKIDVEKCLFKNNHGTAINITNKATADVLESLITDSLAVNKKPPFPSVKARDDARLTMTKCVIQGGCGAGVHAEEGGKIHLLDCKILNNKEAGARALRRGQITLKNCDIKGNKIPKRLGSRGKIIEK